MSRKSAKEPIETQIINAIGSGIVAIVGGLFRLIMGRKTVVEKVGNAPTMAQLQSTWERVEFNAMQPAHLAKAIMDADMVVDGYLQRKRLKGNTMMERMRAGEHLFSPSAYYQLRMAHKLRNTLAHEVGFQLNQEEGKQAIAAFRQAIRELS